MGRHIPKMLQRCSNAVGTILRISGIPRNMFWPHRAKAFFLAFLDKWHLTIVEKINFLPESI